MRQGKLNGKFRVRERGLVRKGSSEKRKFNNRRSQPHGSGETAGVKGLSRQGLGMLKASPGR